MIRYASPANFMTQASGQSAMGPPWSNLTAYDLNTGTIRWQVPNGGVLELEKDGHTGTGARDPRGGPVVTAGGLIFAATASDHKFAPTTKTTARCSGSTNSDRLGWNPRGVRGRRQGVHRVLRRGRGRPQPGRQAWHPDWSTSERIRGLRLTEEVRPKFSGRTEAHLPINNLADVIDSGRRKGRQEYI